jgi:hypothetical protein
MLLMQAFLSAPNAGLEHVSCVVLANTTGANRLKRLYKATHVENEQIKWNAIKENDWIRGYMVASHLMKI